MKKGIFIFIFLILALFSVSCIYAADVNDTLAASEDTGEIELSHEIESADDNLGTSEKQIVTQTDNEEKIGQTDNGTFQALKDKIQGASPGTVNLENNYSCEDSWTQTEGIIIGTSNLVIDGQGYTIDAKQKTRIFHVNAENVTIKNIKFINAKVYSDFGGAIYWSNSANGSVSGCSFVNCSAQHDGGAIDWHDSVNGSVSGCCFVNCSSDIGCGGAINWYYSGGSVSGCSFVNCSADIGGAICWDNSDNGIISDCVFIKCTAYPGIAIYILDSSASLNRNWFGNTAENYESSPNEYIRGATTDNWLFLNATVNPESISTAQTADIIFKLYLYSNTGITDYTSLAKVDLALNSNGILDKNVTGLDENVTFTPTSIGTGNITATIENVAYTTTLTVTTDGTTFWDLNNAINGNANDTITLDRDYAYNPASDSAFTEGIVINRPVTINGNGYTINANGKARIFQITGNDVVLENITFINGHTTGNGGAIRFTSSCTVTNCNFTNNSAQYGGAIRLGLGNVTNCNFINNTAANYGGALLMANGNVSNCNFINNTAENGGAIRFNGDGAVTNCNFTYNNATIGSAIYFYSTSATKNVSNSIFLNNRAKAEVLDVVKNDNNIIITFTGQNNLLNAIFSRNDAKVTFTNVTYWGKNGLATISDTISGSNGEAGQNITVIMVVNDILILNTTEVTDENGQIVLDAVAGNCTITALHIEDSYYTYAETTETFNIRGNETPLKLNVSGHTVTAALSPDIAAANVTFTLSNESGVVKKVQIALTDGVGELDLTGLIGDYNITATYGGNINYYPCIATISISDEVPFNVSDAIISFGDVANIVVGVPEAINGQNISISVNGTSKNATAKEGKAIADFTDLPAGEYLIIVDYFGDGYHSANSTTMNLTVNKVDSILNVDDVVLDYGTSANVTVTIEGATGIIAKINDKEAVVENNTISIPVLDAGTYTLTVTAIADSNHNNITKNVTITVNKAKTQIDAKAVTATYNVNKNLVITLKDANGKALSGVKITVQLKDTKTYTTNKNGQVKISTKGLAPKKYTAKITFNGDKNYAKSTKDVKVTVKKVKAKIYAKKKTYKAKTKTKKFKIKLKDKNGKAIKNAKVRLIVKKIKKTSKGKNKKSEKKYKKNIKKTNKKGKITFKIKRNKKGKYLATVKFYGNKYYAKTVKKVKIKMK